MKKALLILSILSMTACSVTNNEKALSPNENSFNEGNGMIVVGGLFKNKPIVVEGIEAGFSIIEERTKCKESGLVGLENLNKKNTCKSIVMIKIMNQQKFKLSCDIVTNERIIVMEREVVEIYARDLILKEGETLNDVNVTCKKLN